MHHVAATTTTFLLISFSVLQFALYGQCQFSGPPITPSTLSLSTVPTSGSSTATTTVRSGNSSSISATATSSAEFPSLSGYSSCVSNCLALGVSAANCTSLVDVDCFCNRPTFTQELYTCVTSTCSSSDLSSAESLAQQFCNIASSKPTLSFPSTSSSSASSSASSESSSTPTITSTSTLTAPSATSSNAALSSNSRILFLFRGPSSSFGSAGAAAAAGLLALTIFSVGAGSIV